MIYHQLMILVMCSLVLQIMFWLDNEPGLESLFDTTITSHDPSRLVTLRLCVQKLVTEQRVDCVVA